MQGLVPDISVRAAGLAIRCEFKFVAGVRARGIVLTDCTSQL